MRKIRITETDASFLEGFTSYIIELGAKPILFEIPDDFDAEALHGIEIVEETPSRGGSPGVDFAKDFPQVVEFLKSYRGPSSFLQSLQDQLARKGTLSVKQIECVKKQLPIVNDGGLPETTFSISPGVSILLTKFISNRIAESLGYKRAFRLFEIVAVEAETPKAYRCKVKLSARRTSFCSICGLTLENPDSIVAGVGPICADNYGIPYGDRSFEELQKIVTATVETSAWVPKVSIKWRSDQPEEKRNDE